MILNMNKNFKRKILLSEFDLQNNDFDQYQVSAFFKNAIISDLRLNNEFTDVYLNYIICQFPQNSKFEDLNGLMKEEINKQQNLITHKDNKILYTYLKVGDKNQDNINDKYIIIYPSKCSNDGIFDIDNYTIFYDKKFFINYLLSRIIKLTLNCLLIKDENDKSNISEDLFYGDLLINVSKNESGFSGFLPIINSNNYKLWFSLSTQEYIYNTKSDKTSNENIKEAGIVSTKNKNIKKVDARKSKRVFLKVEDKEFLSCKYSSYLYIYEKLQQVFNCLNLDFEETNFTPEYVFNDFIRNTNFDSSKSLKVIISQEDMEKLQIKNINFLLEKIKENFRQEPELLIFNKLSGIKFNNESKYLFLMFREKEEMTPVVLNIDGEEYIWNNTGALFADMQNEKENDLSKKLFDDYTQLKLCNINNLLINSEFSNPLAIQGIFINNKKFDTEKNIKSLKNQLCKSIADLYLKDKLFNIKEIDLPDSSYKNIKVLKKESIKINNFKYKNKQESKNYYSRSYTKQNLTVYSYLCLEKKDKSDSFNVSDAFIITENKDKRNKNYENQYPKILIDLFNTTIIPEKDQLGNDNFGQYLLLIDDKYLIRFNDNKFNSKTIGFDNIVAGAKNPNKLIFEAMENGDLARVIEEKKLAQEYKKINGLKVAPKVDGILNRKSGIENNLFFPFNMPTFNEIVDPENHDKKNKKLKRGVAIISFDKNKATYFIQQTEDAFATTMDKSNLIEKVSIQTKQDSGVYKNSNEEETKEIFEFYLKTLTYDLISNKRVAKKSIITKLVDFLFSN